MRRTNLTKALLLGFGLIFAVAMSLGCDENNNVMAQDNDPGSMEHGPMDPAPMVEAMTMVTGKVIAPGNQCDGRLDGFSNGDEVMIEMNAGTEETQPGGKVVNMTTGNSVDCGGNEAVMDDPLLLLLVCESENSQVSSFKNGDFMTMLVDFSWIQSFKEDISKSAYIINQNIDFVKDLDLKNAPCARVMIETITAAGS